MKASKIAIIGAGFSGTLLALHLLRLVPRGTHITLIERHRQFGLGQAYSTANPGHLLNVPAGNMSAFHDRPGDFLEWLEGLPSGDLGNTTPTAASFVPRRLFGAYIRQLLNEEMRNRENSDQLTLMRGNVVGIDGEANPLVLRFDRGSPMEADIVVLAIGDFHPKPMPVPDRQFHDIPLYRPDPWAPDAVKDLDQSAPVVLLGTGLTMVDTVVSLLDQGHHGLISALSRRGLLPHRHICGLRPTEPLHPYPASLLALTRFLRNEAKAAIAAGGDWRPVVDSLRPFIHDIWQALSVEDRRRFLRHLRPWWNVHRHRMAAPVADRIEAAFSRRQLRIYRGRIRAFKIRSGKIDVIYRPPGIDAPETLTAARVINCCGPVEDLEHFADPLIRALLRQGDVRPDPLGMGLDVTATCALRMHSGAISRRLFAVGPVTKAAFWEITAVPDIRRQCEALAYRLAALVEVTASSHVPVAAGPRALVYSI
jgi:uncharacterized NAD(P)/FAD-binding protein YdhS